MNILWNKNQNLVKHISAMENKLMNQELLLDDIE